jgi:hypothetical protein
MIVSLLLFSIARANAQRPLFELLQENDVYVIPFDIVNDFILIELNFNRILPLKFIFDTGASNTILFKKEYAEIFGFPFDRNVEILGSDLVQKIDASIIRNIPIDIVGLGTYSQDFLVLEENYFNLEKLLGVTVDGILGAGLFKEQIFKIDYHRNELVVYKRSAFKGKFKDYYPVKIDFKDGKPYTELSTVLNHGDTLDLTYLIDTGAGIPLLLYTTENNMIQVPENNIRGVLGMGLGGELIGYMGKTTELTIGGVKFANIITSFQNNPNQLEVDVVKKHGIIGNSLLKRFTLIFNYRENVIYFKPGRKVNKEFSVDKSGIVIFAFGVGLNKYFVQDVVEGSPADLAGVLKGDIILKVNRVPASIRGLSKIQNILQKNEGKRIRLVVQRENEKRTIIFCLKNLI